jgi:hypothetical protein
MLLLRLPYTALSWAFNSLPHAQERRKEWENKFQSRFVSLYLIWAPFFYKSVAMIGTHENQNKQVGAPTVPSAVFRGSIRFEDFWCHRRVNLSKCVTSISILNLQICIFFAFFSSFFVS